MLTIQRSHIYYTLLSMMINVIRHWLSMYTMLSILQSMAILSLNIATNGHIAVRPCNGHTTIKYYSRMETPHQELQPMVSSLSRLWRQQSQHLKTTHIHHATWALFMQSAGMSCDPFFTDYEGKQIENVRKKSPKVYIWISLNVFVTFTSSMNINHTTICRYRWPHRTFNL